MVRLCTRHGAGPCYVPPSPHVIAGLFAEYKAKGFDAVDEARGGGRRVSFREYLRVVGYTDHSWCHVGMDDRFRRSAPGPVPELLSLPTRAVAGNVRVKVLLVDFSDMPGTLPRNHYERLLFSDALLPTQSMREFYAEVSRSKVSVSGEVHGWFRMPQPYSYYSNHNSGTKWADYPRNAPRLAEDAVAAALNAQVAFPPDLDVLHDGTVTALFIVHAGVGAERLNPVIRNEHIWSHKWNLRTPKQVAPGMWAAQYLVVPHDCDVGVCAHELGHLAFQWQDFYDPNYAEDGDAWDGAGRWDLMAGGSYNGDGARPAHPAALHKTQHGWLGVQEVTATTNAIVVKPVTAPDAEAIRIRSGAFTASQYLLLENRTAAGFDASLPGAGLLVWRVDEIKEMEGSEDPGMALIQADGRGDLSDPSDFNQGDRADPFPGSKNERSLGDDPSKKASTTFPGGPRSGISFSNITLQPDGTITLDITVAASPSAGAAPPSAKAAGAKKAAQKATATIKGEVENGQLDEAVVSIEGRDIQLPRNGVGEKSIDLAPGRYALAFEARGRPKTRWKVSASGAGVTATSTVLTVAADGFGFKATTLEVT